MSSSVIYHCFLIRATLFSVEIHFRALPGEKLPLDVDYAIAAKKQTLFWTKRSWDANFAHFAAKTHSRAVFRQSQVSFRTVIN